MTGVTQSRASVDVDFSLAIHNRTGKYFIGRDVIAVLAENVGCVYYGPLPLHRAPVGLGGRLLGRLQRWQVMSRIEPRRARWPRRPRNSRPLIHLDPFTVPTTDLREYDVVVCHDIGPLTHPELFDPGVCAAYHAIYAHIARVGPHAVFVSKASEEEFHSYFPGARLASSRVIYPALRVEIAHIDTPVDDHAAAPYLLTVGSIGARKNQLRCIAAFAASGLADRGFRYVVCGGEEPGFGEVAQLAARTPGVDLRAYVSDLELATLYRNARGFVLASLLEGFGIPVAEAIAHGLVPAVSSGGVLDEVAGPGAVRLDPLDERQIADAMVQLCDMDELERQARRRLLADAVSRFDVESFARGWKLLAEDVDQHPR